jgi:DNA polymerase/3'-5' exonuclease PolX
MMKSQSDPKAFLTPQQQVGLKYVDDVAKRIPREEVAKHLEQIQAALAISGLLPSITRMELAGSYRRGMRSCGDVDVVIEAAPLPKSTRRRQDVVPIVGLKDIVDALKASGYIVDDLAQGTEKYMGIARVGQFHRRLDLHFVRQGDDKWPFVLLYMTGSADFVRRLRRKAQLQGLSLSEHGITCCKDRNCKDGSNKLDEVVIDLKKRSSNISDERDIFDALGEPYVPPHMRLG